VLEVNGVVAVQVRPIRHATRITAPHRAGEVIRWEAEGVGMLAETVDVRVLREVGRQAEVLRLKHEGVLAGGEQHLVVLGADDFEREGRGCVGKLDGRFGGRDSARHSETGEGRFGDLAAVLSRVGDFEVDSCFWVLSSDTFSLGDKKIIPVL
jgi:hypothetical protein